MTAEKNEVPDTPVTPETSEISITKNQLSLKWSFLTKNFVPNMSTFYNFFWREGEREGVK